MDDDCGRNLVIGTCQIFIEKLYNQSTSDWYELFDGRHQVGNILIESHPFQEKLPESHTQETIVQVD